MISTKQSTFKIFAACFMAMLAFPGGANASALKGQTITLGVETDISGVFGDLGGQGSVEAVKMAEDDFVNNEHPDFNVELISADHQNKPDIATQIANDWFKNKGVDVIIGLTNSGAALGVGVAADLLHKPVIITGAGSAAITNEKCKPLMIHYGYDTHALSVSVVNALMKAGHKNFFIVFADYAFGKSLTKEASEIIAANGGKVLGTIGHGENETNFDSAMLAAQSSGADVVLLASAGATMQNASKAANAFGLTKKQIVVGMLTDVTDVKAMGLKDAQKMTFASGFNPNRTPIAKAWDERFFAIHHSHATMLQASDYSAAYHYLEAVKKTGSRDGATVVAAMKAAPVNDILTGNGHIREDGLLEREMYVAVVKTPAESKGPWDLLNITEIIPGSEAYGSLKNSTCPLVKK